VPDFALSSPNEHEASKFEQRLCFQITTRKDWRRGAESNRRIKVLQTSALPLGYRALSKKQPDPSPTAQDFLSGLKRPLNASTSKNPRSEGSGSLEFLERETGFEPATSTLARSHSTTELLPLSKGHYIDSPEKRQNKGPTQGAACRLSVQIRYHATVSCGRRSLRPRSPGRSHRARE
jgi:hypothetical protein